MFRTLQSLTTVIFICLFLTACSDVNKGSWYENIKTSEKIKIEDVGRGQEILDRLKKTGGRYWYISGADIYRDEQCFSYVTETHDTPPVLHIEPITRLKEDYLKIK